MRQRFLSCSCSRWVLFQGSSPINRNCIRFKGCLVNAIEYTYLPVSKRTGNVIPATVTFPKYCAFAIFPTGTEVRRFSEEGCEVPKRTSKGKIRPLTREPKIVRRKESDSKERIGESAARDREWPSIRVRKQELQRRQGGERRVYSV